MIEHGDSECVESAGLTELQPRYMPMTRIPLASSSSSEYRCIISQKWRYSASARRRVIALSTVWSPPYHMKNGSEPSNLLWGAGPDRVSKRCKAGVPNLPRTGFFMVFDLTEIDFYVC